MKRIHSFAAAIAALGVLGGAAYFMNGEKSLVESAFAQDEATVEAALSEETLATLVERGYAVGELSYGDPDAPVTIIEYSRLDCPACATYHARTAPQLNARYVETGMARIVMREVYTNPLGLTAGVVARCSGPDRYFSFIEALFDTQGDWARSRTMEELRASIGSVARLGGLSSERMDECLSDELFIDHIIAATARDADASGITKTPTLFVNGVEFTGAYTDIDALGAMIEAAAAEAGAADAVEGGAVEEAVEE